MCDETDDEIKAKIRARYPNATAQCPYKSEIPDVPETRGTNKKSRWWHALAIEHIARLEAGGATRNAACREFQQLLASTHNHKVAVGTVMDVVRSHYGRFAEGRYSRKEAERYFKISVIDNDLDEAVFWYKRLTYKQKKEIGLVK